MKSFNYYLIAAITVFAAAAIFHVVDSSESKLLKANVKALAQITVPKVGDRGLGKCYNTVTIDYLPDGNVDKSQIVLFCGSCTYVLGKPAFLSGTGNCADYIANI